MSVVAGVDSLDLRLEEIVLGVIGIGNEGSLGFRIAVDAGKLPFVSRIYLNERNKVDKLTYFRDHVVGNNVLKYVVPENPDDVDRVKEDTADKCDVILFCFDGGRGASKGGMTSAPPDIRRRLFDANIDAMIEYARFFGKRRSEALFAVCTNPPDLLSYFFSKAYWAARGEPERHDNVIGLNLVDTIRYRQLVEKFIHEELGKEPKSVHAEMWGPHDGRAFPVVSQCSYEDGSGNRIKLCGSGVDPSVLRSLGVEVKKVVPFKLLELFTSTTTDTSHSIEELLHAVSNSGEVCSVSYPVPHTVQGSCVAVPFMGLPVRFEDNRAVVLEELIGKITPDEREDYDCAVRSCSDEVSYLLSSQRNVKKHVALTKPHSKVGENPRFFRELVIPKKSRDSRTNEQSWLHFHNFTYPFNDDSEVREPIRVVGDTVSYISNVVMHDENMLAVLHTGSVSHGRGVQIVNPITRESENYALPMDEERLGVHCNGCCTIDDVVIASVNGRGLFRGMLTGRVHSDGVKEGLLEHFGSVPDNFKGYVRVHKDHLYYLAGTGVVEAVLGSDGPEVTREYPVECSDLNNFAIFDRKPSTQKDERDMRVFVTTKHCVLYESVDGEGVPVNTVSRASGIAGPDLRYVSVEYLFGNYYLVFSRSDKLLLRKLDNHCDLRSVQISCGEVMSFAVADLADKLVIVSGSNRDSSNPQSYFYDVNLSERGVEEGKTVEASPVWSADFLISKVCCYSEFRS